MMITFSALETFGDVYEALFGRVFSGGKGVQVANRTLCYYCSELLVAKAMRSVYE
jgi:hypothetical protein